MRLVDTPTLVLLLQCRCWRQGPSHVIVSLVYEKVSISLRLGTSTVRSLENALVFFICHDGSRNTNALCATEYDRVGRDEDNTDEETLACEGMENPCGHEGQVQCIYGEGQI